jgi:2-polyprenyl-3-methyl-5-hydroxy-6-metoxy-1,4-benzoquinol methylase
MSEASQLSANQLSRCPICGSAASAFVWHKDGYNLVRCSSCATVYVSPLPSDEFLAAHYQAGEYFEGDSSQGYRNYADMRKALLPHFRRRLQVLDAQFPARGRLLDYGCAAGYFLQVAQHDGWQIAGVELSADMARQAEQTLGIPIAGDLAQIPPDPFNVITLWEVIEHLPRPVSDLRRLFERLRPGGALMLSTPNTGHWQAAREPEAWVGYRPPSHLLYFTRVTLAEALHRAGFECISVRGVSPLPRLPGWLRRLSDPLRRGLAEGQAAAWPVALWTWRAIRVAGWGWHRLAHQGGDVFTTLEALAFRLS